MVIDFSLSRGDIVLRAKDDTYLSARAALVDQTGNKDARYEMQADERDTHERKLLSSLKDAVSGIKAELNEYLISGDVDDESDTINFSINVSDSFRSSERQGAIATLCENYITKRVISEWWVANYPSFAESYVALTQQALDHLKRAFYYKGEAVKKEYNTAKS
jgi:hypothetical protein